MIARWNCVPVVRILDLNWGLFQTHKRIEPPRSSIYQSTYLSYLKLVLFSFKIFHEKLDGWCVSSTSSTAVSTVHPADILLNTRFVHVLITLTKSNFAFYIVLWPTSKHFQANCYSSKPTQWKYMSRNCFTFCNAIFSRIMNPHPFSSAACFRKIKLHQALYQCLPVLFQASTSFPLSGFQTLWACYSWFETRWYP